MLLENGAEVNAEGGKYGNALQAASSGGYKVIPTKMATFTAVKLNNASNSSTADESNNSQ
jgi:hypothetical protein